MLDRPTSQSGWQARADALIIEGRAFIDGAYAPAASGRTFGRVSPIDGRVIAQVADCEAADVNRAVAAARRSFGRDRSPHAVEKYTDLKTVWTAYG